MTKASDNPYPSILIEEATEPAAPAAGRQRLYIDSTTHLLKATNSSGTDRTIESTGSALTVKDEGSNLSTAVTSIDFVGAGVAATGTTAVTVTIAGGGGTATEHNEMNAAVLVNATATGDAGNRSDGFTGTSLSGWTSEATAATTLAVKYSVLSVVQSSGANHQVRAFTPSGAFEVQCRIYCRSNAGGGGIIVRDSGTGDSSGNGMAFAIDSATPNITLYSLDTGTYTSRATLTTTNYFDPKDWFYLSLARNGSNVWTAQASRDRVIWVPFSGTYSKTFTVAKAGIRFGTASTGVDFFDVVS